MIWDNWLITLIIWVPLIKWEFSSYSSNFLLNTITFCIQSETEFWPRYVINQNILFLSDISKNISHFILYFSTIILDSTTAFSSFSSPIVKAENYIFVGLLQFLFGEKSKGQAAFHFRKIVKWLTLKCLPNDGVEFIFTFQWNRMKTQIKALATFNVVI